MERRSSTISSACSSPRSSLSSAHADFGVFQEGHGFGEQWEEDRPNCGACGAKLGKLRRHHCRICGLCVCSGCSSSTVHLEGQRRPQRACTLCVAAACAAPTVKRRLAQLGATLRAMGGDNTAESHGATTLLEAAAICEGAVLPVGEALAAARGRTEAAEAALAAEKQKREDLAAELSSATAFLLLMGERLHAVGGTKPSDQPPSTCSAVAAAEFCDAALGALSKAGRSRSREQKGTPVRTRARSNASQASSTPRPCSRSSVTEADPNRDEGARERLESEAVSIADWEEDTAACGSCGAKLGKRYFRPRHHCRLCGRCVCAQCSPNSMQLDDQKGLQRVCTRCVADAQQATSFKKRMLQLGSRLRVLGQLEEVTEPLPSSSLARVFSYCESALPPLEALCSSAGEAASPSSTEHSGA
uniref:FYVE-type domain-containing protein n=1 Tax=Alexandrium monilatum TaxID=311494 RepID=A0A7S4PVX5_9DINO